MRYINLHFTYLLTFFTDIEFIGNLTGAQVLDAPSFLGTNEFLNTRDISVRVCGFRPTTASCVQSLSLFDQHAYKFSSPYWAYSKLNSVHMQSLSPSLRSLVYAMSESSFYRLMTLYPYRCNLQNCY